MYPVLFTLGNINIFSSPVFLVLGIVTGILVGWKEARRVGIPDLYFHGYWISAIPVALLFGALNALVFQVGLWDAFRNLEHALSSGLVSFGAVLGMFAWAYILIKLLKFQQSAGVALDVIAVILPLILGIYRIGCILNGCCYGIETDSIFGMVLPDHLGVWARRFPTQIVLMIFNLALFAWLWKRRKRMAYDGSLTLLYLFVYALGRLMIDSLRDLPRLLGPLSLQQLTSIAVLLITGYIAFEIRQDRLESDHGNTPSA